MCGIMGYLGEENAVDVIINGLETLEYRGYDSAGIALLNNNKFEIKKTIGTPKGLYKKTRDLHSNIGIGHTRWATHGSVTEANAHPHVSQNQLFSVVHNGIIENYNEIKDLLEKKGYCFISETDTEVIAHLLEENYRGDLKGAVSKTIIMLKGSFALGILCSDYPDTIVCAKKSSPLFVGTSTDNVYLASDISAISEQSNRIFRLNDGEIGVLKKDGLKVFDSDGCRIKKSELKIKKQDNQTDKHGYEHYMLKEIYEQPDAIKNTLSEIMTGKKLTFKSIKWSSDEIKQISNVCFIACGSAYHAGLVGAYLCEEYFKRSAKAEVASEFRYKNPHINENTLVVIISQSGETADTLAALRIAKKKNAKIISIVNAENSTIAMESDCVIFTKAGKEIAVATTKAYSSQLAVIYALIIYLSVISTELDKKTAGIMIDELKSVPQKIEDILRDTQNIYELSKTITNYNYVCFIGRKYGYCTANEGALKLKEISYLPCDSYAAGELKHGTISLIDKNSLVIALSSCNSLRDKMSSNINEVTARKGNVIRITDQLSSGEIKIPTAPDYLYPMLEVIPLQLLAYYVAKNKGCEIDKPRNLAKSVTVE